MKILNILESPPLPDDWDKAIYAKQGGYSAKIAYAKERAKKVGQGSSRVAFVIDYQGRKTVLKIAKNKKGLYQNEHEQEALSDYYLKQLKVFIPMIDYDKESAQPSWLHVEFAEKVKESDFRKATGGSLDDLLSYVAHHARPREEKDHWGNYQNVDSELEFVHDFETYVGNYPHHSIGDYASPNNWGMYGGRPVIIDIGLSNEIMQQFYS